MSSPTLNPGTRLGPYEILSALGAGGMGEVYRATDTNLKRQVAIKVLPQTVAADPERLARFQREAEVLAALNHPNIAHIHGLEKSDGTLALVMELVEGPTLADRIAQGPIPMAEALPIARQIADALEAAHEQGIIHRDLKPANIKVRDDGTVNVLDFGLAKAMEPTGPSSANAMNSPTISMHATQAGVILGTAAYMSPEQARGNPVDRRADIWAFGCVLYEMLTGARAFAGGDVPITIASVLKDDLNWNALPTATPPDVRRLLRACLQKDRAQRLQAIGDARLFLETRDAVSGSVPTARPRAVVLWMAAWAVLAAALSVLLVMRLREAPAPNHVVTLTVPPPPNTFIREAAISPDGTHLVLSVSDRVGKRTLWMRRLESLELQALPGTEGGARPFWSPDNRFLGFYAGTRLMKFDLERGSTQFLHNTGETAGSAWLSDGSIIFARVLGGLFRLRPGSNDAQPLTTLDTERKESRHYWPTMLPDNRHFLFLVSSALPEVQGIWVASLDNPTDRRRLLGDLGLAEFSSGYLFFVRGDTLMRQPFDVGRLALGGEATLVFEHVAHTITGYGAYSTAADGSFTAMRTPQPWRLTWFDRDGKPLGAFGAAGRYLSISLSPDEKRIAVDADSDVAPGYKIFVIDHERDTTMQVTVGEVTGSFPVWSADGHQLAFGSDREGVYNIYVEPSTGGGQEELVWKDDRSKFLFDWSRDGRFLLYGERQARTPNVDLWTLPMVGDRKPALYLRGTADLRGGRFSPDGRWVAYQSDETSRSEVYVQSFPAGADKVQISINGGTRPAWRADGKELYYLTDTGTLMAVPVKPGAGFAVGAPQPLFQTWATGILLGYAPTRDGRRFVFLAPGADSAFEPATVVLNRR